MSQSHDELMTVCFFLKAAATRSSLEWCSSGCGKRRDMHATEYLHVSGGDRWQRGLPLPKRLHAAASVLRSAIVHRFPSIPGHDLVPRWRMGHRSRSFRILRAQVSAGSRSRPRHRELPVKFRSRFLDRD